MVEQDGFDLPSFVEEDEEYAAAAKQEQRLKPRRPSFLDPRLLPRQGEYYIIPRLRLRRAVPHPRAGLEALSRVPFLFVSHLLGYGLGGGRGLGGELGRPWRQLQLAFWG
ncbi:hypothetical protein E2562_008456 [Oryza meyeriana var. granulata]|uniref:Uncharacterized protein n=1 Tax=Oryza meyeriana var. granulata TaxID=110450 RepID=A0A6G1EHA8_9ORYZ|nr:hypothetical protein E2562_008456 [Oryza meyeriana var. granulata]